MVSSSESSCGGSPAFLGGGGGGVVSSAVSPRSNSPFTVARYAGRRSEGERERERTFQFGGFPPQRERERFPYDAMPLCGLYCVLEQGSGVAKVFVGFKGIGRVLEDRNYEIKIGKSSLLY